MEVPSEYRHTLWVWCSADGKKLFIVLSDCWYGGALSPPHLGVHMCERDGGCLVPGA